LLFSAVILSPAKERCHLCSKGFFALKNGCQHMAEYPALR
jgi:hypothetical protein